MTYRITLTDNQDRKRMLYIQNVEIDEAKEMAKALNPKIISDIRCVIGNINMKEPIWNG